MEFSIYITYGNGVHREDEGNEGAEGEGGGRAPARG